MTAADLALILDGREIGEEVDETDAAAAKAAGLIIVYGASDDLAEIDGLFDDEVGVGGEEDSFLVDADGVIPAGRDERWSDAEMSRYFVRKYAAPEKVVTVTAEWCPPGDDTSWRFSASVPFSSFKIFEDGELYCRGIVFAVGG